MKKLILPILATLLLTLTACEKSNSADLQIVNSSDYYVRVSIDGVEIARLNSMTNSSIIITNPSNLEYYFQIERYESSSSKKPVSSGYIYKQLFKGFTYKLFITNDGGKIEGLLKE